MSIELSDVITAQPLSNLKSVGLQAGDRKPTAPELAELLDQSPTTAELQDENAKEKKRKRRSSIELEECCCYLNDDDTLAAYFCCRFISDCFVGCGRCTDSCCEQCIESCCNCEGNQDSSNDSGCCDDNCCDCGDGCCDCGDGCDCGDCADCCDCMSSCCECFASLSSD